MTPEGRGRSYFGLLPIEIWRKVLGWWCRCHGRLFARVLTKSEWFTHVFEEEYFEDAVIELRNFIGVVEPLRYVGRDREYDDWNVPALVRALDDLERLEKSPARTTICQQLRERLHIHPDGVTGWLTHQWPRPHSVFIGEAARTQAVVDLLFRALCGLGITRQLYVVREQDLIGRWVGESALKARKLMESVDAHTAVFIVDADGIFSDLDYFLSPRSEASDLDFFFSARNEAYQVLCSEADARYALLFFAVTSDDTLQSLRPLTSYSLHYCDQNSHSHSRAGVDIGVEFLTYHDR